MKEVAVYIEADFPPVKADRGTVMYVLESQTSKGPATITKCIELERATGNGATLEALAEALGRIREPCRVTVRTDCMMVRQAINGRWFRAWEENGWRTAGGKEVCDVATWKEVAGLLGPHEYGALPNKGSPYRDWMRTELRRAREEAFRALTGRPPGKFIVGKEKKDV